MMENKNKFPASVVTEAECVVCKCRDSRGCEPDEECVSCWWAIVDRDAGIGVCSRCDTPANRKIYELKLKSYLLKNKK